MSDARLRRRVLEAVGDEFEVSTVDALSEVSHDSAGVCVVVFDDSAPAWLGAIAGLVEGNPSLLPLLVADLTGPEEFLAAVAAGVAGFCAADASADAIARTVSSIVASGVAIPRAYVEPLVREARRGRGRVVRTAAGDVVVTEREWEILQMLVQRRSTREMADRLYVSVGTVRSHVSTVLKKIGAVDRDDAIALVERGGRAAANGEGTAAAGR